MACISARRLPDKRTGPLKRLILSITFLAVPASAQDGSSAESGLRSGIAHVKAAPKADITPMLAQSRNKVRRPVYNRPDWDLMLAGPASWSPPSLPIAADTPPSALAIVRMNGPCDVAIAAFQDRIDLTRVRQNGFVLVAFEAVPLRSGPGLIPLSPVEAIAVDSGKGDVSTAFLDRADQIHIRPPLFRRSPVNPAAMGGCWSGYRLSVTLEGPLGVDPFTGKSIFRKYPN